VRKAHSVSGRTVPALFLLALSLAAAEALPPGDEIARRVNARDDGHAASRTLVMELVDRGGATRTRVTRALRRDFGDERRSVLFFEEPANVRGTAFLAHDHADPARDDDHWLYLPALRKSRRVASAERGRSFLGTDLSYEELKKETRLNLEDFHWRTIGEEEVEGRRCFAVEGVTVDEATSRELGYGRVLMRVDAEIWLPRLVEFWTPAGTPLKAIRVLEVREVQGIWTPHRIEAVNHESGHRTNLIFRDVDYRAELPEDLFTEDALRRGPP
jgi:hypothetical protein